MLLLLIIMDIHSATGAPIVVSLRQAACQFVEAEDQNYHFVTSSKKDCVAINNRTGQERISRTKSMTLRAGNYTFRITNLNVPYQVGFYLRGAEILERRKLPRVSGSGLFQGVTKDYHVKLVPGDYIFSCPLNPTPDYHLIVTE